MPPTDPPVRSVRRSRRAQSALPDRVAPTMVDVAWLSYQRQRCVDGSDMEHADAVALVDALDAATAAATQAREEAQRLRAALQRIEWSAGFCLFCLRKAAQGHADPCEWVILTVDPVADGGGAHDRLQDLKWALALLVTAVRQDTREPTLGVSQMLEVADEALGPPIPFDDWAAGS